jgi:hypothetical protein
MAGSMADLLNEDPASRYIDDALGAAASKNVFSSGTLDRLLSFFGKADYNYANRYYASFTLRRDGSSKFPKANQWGTFPAFNVGWRRRRVVLPKEGFFRNVMLRFDGARPATASLRRIFRGSAIGATPTRYHGVGQ